MLAAPRPIPRPVKPVEKRPDPHPGPKYFDVIPLGANAGHPPPSASAASPVIAKKPRRRVALKLKKPGNWLYRWVLPAMAILLFIAGVAITIQTFRTNKALQTKITTPGSTEENASDPDAAIPSEVKPTSAQMSSYQVDPTAPRYLRIPGIKVFARVYALGIDKTGKMRAPNNIYNVGWYDKSARPGESGAVLLDGHSSANRGVAVFDRLDRLKVGSRIEIERGDGKKIMYRVVSVQSFLKDELDMKQGVTSVEPGENGLNMITCGGEYDETTKTYDKRLLVRAVQE